MNCTIRTPQFKDGKIHYYVTQKGIFDESTLYFTTSEVSGHNVQFHSMEDFNKFRVKDKSEKEYWFGKLLKW